MKFSPQTLDSKKKSLLSKLKYMPTLDNRIRTVETAAIYGGWTKKLRDEKKRLESKRAILCEIIGELSQEINQDSVGITDNVETIE